VFSVVPRLLFADEALDCEGSWGGGGCSGSVWRSEEEFKKK